MAQSLNQTRTPLPILIKKWNERVHEATPDAEELLFFNSAFNGTPSDVTDIGYLPNHGAERFGSQPAHALTPSNVESTAGLQQVFYSHHRALYRVAFGKFVIEGLSMLKIP